MNVHGKIIQDLEQSLKFCIYQGTKGFLYTGVYDIMLWCPVRETTTSVMSEEQLLNYM